MALKVKTNNTKNDMENVTKEITQTATGWKTTFEGPGWVCSAEAEVSNKATELALEKLEGCGAPAHVAERLRQLAERQFDRENYSRMSKAERDAYNNL